VLFTAFSVVLGTLVLQGMTLRPLINALQLEDDGSVEREVRLARVESLRAALAATDAVSGDEMSRVLRRRYEILLRRAEANLEAAGDAADGTDGQTLNAGGSFALKAVSAARQRLVALRADGTIGDAAFQRVEQELDWEELDFQIGQGDESSQAR